ncbi:Lsr2 family DNA-binding protein [Nocardia violaceofusca]|uniref:Lsr2 family DNA-binding protein n=1 Tax=Nocardia violaceofusca TaxID=941182 RepID=UPI0007A4945F|nr:histone-like nucleoid-structuring protein Lsr2 [Nocardia violaceofusca]
MTSIADLLRICPPPAHPVSVDWGAVESTLGVKLPTDYKQLATMYGPGNFCEYLRVYHPHGPTEWVNLFGPMPATLRRQLRDDRDTGRFPVPHAPDSLFACGVTDNGEYLFWIAEPADDPDHWRLAINEARGPRWYTFDGSLVAFLAASFSGRIEVPLFPDGLLDDGVSFSRDSEQQLPGSHATDLDSSGAAQTVDPHVIRAWARANGYDLPDRGRIPTAITQAWQRASIRSD